MRWGWKKAEGSCGYNVDGPVYASKIGRIAMFAWQSKSGFWTCSVVGIMSCGGDTLEECQIAGEKAITKCKAEDIDRFIGDEEFKQTVRSDKILGFVNK